MPPEKKSVIKDNDLVHQKSTCKSAHRGDLMIEITTNYPNFPNVKEMKRRKKSR